MDEHLAAWQISELILGCLDDDELETVYRHFDECVDCLGSRRAVGAATYPWYVERDPCYMERDK